MSLENRMDNLAIEDVCRLDSPGKDKLLDSIEYQTLYFAFCTLSRDLITFFMEDLPAELQERMTEDFLGICRGKVRIKDWERAKQAVIEKTREILSSGDGALRILPPPEPEIVCEQEDLVALLGASGPFLFEDDLARAFYFLSVINRRVGLSGITPIIDKVEDPLLQTGLSLLTNHDDDADSIIAELLTHSRQEMHFHKIRLGLCIRGIRGIQKGESLEKLEEKLRNEAASEEGELNGLVKCMAGLCSNSLRYGILALESELATLDDPFLKTGIGLVVDGTEPSLVDEILHSWENTIIRRFAIRQKMIVQGLRGIIDELNPQLMQICLKAFYAESLEEE